MQKKYSDKLFEKYGLTVDNERTKGQRYYIIRKNGAEVGHLSFHWSGQYFLHSYATNNVYSSVANFARYGVPNATEGKD